MGLIKQKVKMAYTFVYYKYKSLKNRYLAFRVQYKVTNNNSKIVPLKVCL